MFSAFLIVVCGLLIGGLIFMKSKLDKAVLSKDAVEASLENKKRDFDALYSRTVTLMEDLEVSNKASTDKSTLIAELTQKLEEAVAAQWPSELKVTASQPIDVSKPVKKKVVKRVKPASKQKAKK